MSDQKEEIYHRKLENMYHAAPINSKIKSRVQIDHKKAKITIQVDPNYFHIANALHGSIYFKALDDSCFFSANSIVEDVFVLTTSFTTYLTRPVSSGTLIAEGKVVNENKTQIIAESVLKNEGREVGFGSGIFVKSKMKLNDIPEYKL